MKMENPEARIAASSSVQASGLPSGTGSIEEMSAEDSSTSIRPEWADRVSAWMLGGPLTTILAALCLVQLATWVPHYLTWPWWCDSDFFAMLAQGWDRGRLPYRDVICNQFPGPIYLFWILGKTSGWGNVMVSQAVDAALVLGLGGALLIWSSRRFGRVLPAAVAYAAFLTGYLSLDYSQVGQRDWISACLVALGLLAAQAFPGRTGRLASSLLMALALTFRPQVVLFVPAMALAIDEGARQGEESWSKTRLALLEWCLACALFLALLYAPVVLSGLLDDFIRNLRFNTGGTRLYRLTARGFATGLIRELMPWKVWVVPCALVLLLPHATASTRRLSWAWLAAFVGALLYKPGSPVVHDYLDHPLRLFGALLLAPLAGVVLEHRRLTPALRLAMLLLLLSLDVTARPLFCRPWHSVAALRLLARGETPEYPPAGYAPHPGNLAAAYYPWKDYRSLLDYLRRNTASGTYVANACEMVPAINGASTRLSPYPADLAWIRFVQPEFEDAFARALEAAPDSVVVWTPGDEEDTDHKFKSLETTIRRLYELDARFGKFEVWRRGQAE